MVKSKKRRISGGNKKKKKSKKRFGTLKEKKIRDEQLRKLFVPGAFRSGKGFGGRRSTYHKISHKKKIKRKTRRRSKKKKLQKKQL